jgi:hypothetical protein
MTNRALAASAACAIATVLALAPPAGAAFGIESFGGRLADPSGQPLLQAGAHPDVTTSISFNTVIGGGGVEEPDGNVRTVEVDLPPGVIGNPTALPRCTFTQLSANGAVPACPVESQAGVVTITTYAFGPFPTELPVYNMVPPPGVPGQFAFNVLGVLVFVNAEVRSGGDYGLTARIENISQGLPLGDTDLTLWGVPADPSHDPQRYDVGGQVAGVPSSAPRRPLMTNPTRCTGAPLETRMRTRSWQDPGQWHSAAFDEDLSSNPLVIEGCQRLPFAPRMTVQPTSRRADSPTGLDVRLTVPQNENPDGLASAHLRRAVVRFPEGMTLSPASADGLGSCSPQQIALDSAASPTCPDSSKIGTVEIDTPLLEQPLQGSIYVAEQRNNPFGTLVAIYVVAEGSGVVLKLPGRIDLDQATGRMTATFDNNPQQPFDSLTLRFKAGPRAALSNPPACGAHRTEVEMTSWASDTPVVQSDTFTVAEGCDARAALSPSLSAGLVDATAGSSSSFVMDLARDSGPNVSAIDLTLPAGLLATVRGVPLCDTAAGACPEGSRIGSTTLAVGPGASPAWLPQAGRAPTAVYLGGPYRGAPYSLVIEVPAQVGPFDLGTVIVRAAVFVDPVDARLRVVSDPLPQILEGIPIAYRRIRVTIDRPGFMRAPTSCAAKRVTGTIAGADGRTAAVASPFRAAGCRALGFAPRLRLALTGRRQTAVDRHPGLTARLTMPRGHANLRRMAVRLPLALALDPETSRSERLCEYEDGLRADCPRRSIVGTATARTPILNRPLTGPVYFVKGVRFSRQGRRIRTLPTLLVKLSGEVELHLRARSSVSRGRLVATFDPIPDAPISSFAMKLDGGRDGVLVVTRRLCGRRQLATARSTGQNGRSRSETRAMRTPCR